MKRRLVLGNLFCISPLGIAGCLDSIESVDYDTVFEKTLKEPTIQKYSIEIDDDSSFKILTEVGGTAYIILDSTGDRVLSSGSNEHSWKAPYFIDNTYIDERDANEEDSGRESEIVDSGNYTLIVAKFFGLQTDRYAETELEIGISNNSNPSSNHRHDTNSLIEYFIWWGEKTLLSEYNPRGDTWNDTFDWDNLILTDLLRPSNNIRGSHHDVYLTAKFFEEILVHSEFDFDKTTTVNYYENSYNHIYENMGGRGQSIDVGDLFYLIEVFMIKSHLEEEIGKMREEIISYVIKGLSIKFGLSEQGKSHIESVLNQNLSDIINVDVGHILEEREDQMKFIFAAWGELDLDLVESVPKTKFLLPLQMTSKKLAALPYDIRLGNVIEYDEMKIETYE